MLRKLSFVCFGILLSILVGANSASACGELLLASQGTDFGKLSCDASGYVVLDPKSKADLIGYEVNSQKVVKKNSVGGDSFQNDKNKAKIQVIESTSGNDTFRFACKKSPKGFVAINQNNTDLIFTPGKNNTKTELTWGSYEFCLTKPLSDDTDFDFKLTSSSRPAIFDIDGNIDNGFQTSFKIPKNQWDKTKVLQIYYTKDDKNTSSDLELSVTSKKSSDSWPASPVYKVALKDSIKNEPKAKVSTGFDITLDYRYDPPNLQTQTVGVIPQADRDLIRQIADEFEANLLENSRTLKGWVNFTGVLGSFPGTVDNGTLRRYYRYRQDPLNSTIPSGFKTLEYADDLTILTTPCYFKNIGTGQFAVSTSIGAEASYFEGLPSFLSGYTSAKNPIYGFMCINYPYFANRSLSEKKQIIRHEMMHILGSVDGFVNLPRNTSAFFDNADNFFKFNGSEAKKSNTPAGTPLKMDTKLDNGVYSHTKHYASGESFENDTVMTPFVKNDLGMTLLDKRTLADNGYCVAGINNNPCN